jgi:ribosomal-protein-alanine N-acetyltransferase
MMAMPTAIDFRSMTVADIPIVVELERATYPQPWSEGVFTDELSRTDRTYILAEVDGAMVGFGGLMFVEQDAHVTTLAVNADARKRGLGTRLMLELINAGLARGAQNLTLEVRASNDGARRLYDRFGMVAVGVRKHYYRDDDAVIMWATDIDQPEYLGRLAEIRTSLGSNHE